MSTVLTLQPCQDRMMELSPKTRFMYHYVKGGARVVTHIRTAHTISPEVLDEHISSLFHNSDASLSWDRVSWVPCVVNRQTHHGSSSKNRHKATRWRVFTYILGIFEKYSMMNRQTNTNHAKPRSSLLLAARVEELNLKWPEASHNWKGTPF